MADKRKPETVLWVRRGKKPAVKVELFKGRCFPAEEFDNADGEPIPATNIEHFWRMRVDGAWYPHGYKRMYSSNQCVELIKKAVFP